MKIDLHLHSKFSTRPSQWVLQKLNCPESFTEPLRIYEEARRKGMGLVTITDHFITGERCTVEERLFSSDEMIRLALETAVA